MSVGTTWDAVTAQRYDFYTQHHPSYQRAAADLVRHLDPAPDWTVADLGCGTGVSTTVLLAQLSQAGAVLAIDASPEMLAIARQRVGDNRIRWVEGPAEEVLSGPDAPTGLDGAIANCTIWQMPVTVLPALRACMHEGGALVFNTGPDLLGVGLRQPPGLAHVVEQVAREEYGFTRPSRPPEERYMGPRSPEQLEEVLANAGFSVASQWTFEVPETPESERDWLLVPIFNQHQLRGLPDRARLEIIERAYEIWDKDCRSRTSEHYCLRVLAT